MNPAVEIDFVVSDTIKALALYKKVFGVETVEATALEPGTNEAVFTLFGSRFHMLDNNPEYGLVAPDPDKPGSVWFNLVVPDIKELFGKATAEGFSVVQPVTELADFGVINAMVKDPFGYVWMFHQITKEVSFEERVRLLTNT